MERTLDNGKRIRLVLGDITRVPVDAMANAANSALAGGGGVDGAIHRAGGPSLMRELDGIRARIAHCPTGSAVATTAGNLPAKWVFHAVGPIYRGGAHREAELLASCYRECLRLAGECQARTISFPSISTGVYGYPVEEAACVAVGAVVEILADPTSSVEEAIFVLFDRGTFDAYATALGGYNRA